MSNTPLNHSTTKTDTQCHRSKAPNTFQQRTTKSLIEVQLHTDMQARSPNDPINHKLTLNECLHVCVHMYYECVPIFRFNRCSGFYKKHCQKKKKPK